MAVGASGYWTQANALLRKNLTFQAPLSLSLSLSLPLSLSLGGQGRWQKRVSTQSNFLHEGCWKLCVLTLYLSYPSPPSPLICIMNCFEISRPSVYLHLAVADCMCVLSPIYKWPVFIYAPLLHNWIYIICLLIKQLYKLLSNLCLLKWINYLLGFWILKMLAKDFAGLVSVLLAVDDRLC